jgi:hypothetical protein
MQILKITCIATFCLDFFSGLNEDTLLIPTKVKSNCQQENIWKNDGTFKSVRAIHSIRPIRV